MIAYLGSENGPSGESEDVTDFPGCASRDVGDFMALPANDLDLSARTNPTGREISIRGQDLLTQVSVVKDYAPSSVA